jgi:hypothetical protein
VSAAHAAIPDGPYAAADVPALQVVRDTTQPDVAAATRAARALLDALGLDTTAEGMADTPGRMARAYAELFSARPFAATTFPNDEGYDELVLARAIPLRSVWCSACVGWSTSPGAVPGRQRSLHRHPGGPPSLGRSALLCVLARRRLGDWLGRDRHGTLRVAVPLPDFAEYPRRSTAQIRRFGARRAG